MTCAGCPCQADHRVRNFTQLLHAFFGDVYSVHVALPAAAAQDDAISGGDKPGVARAVGLSLVISRVLSKPSAY